MQLTHLCDKDAKCNNIVSFFNSSSVIIIYLANILILHNVLVIMPPREPLGYGVNSIYINPLKK